MSTKELVRHALDAMPDDVSIDELIERLYLIRKIENGLREADAGEVIDHDELMRELDDTNE